jgi:hypothetical protein
MELETVLNKVLEKSEIHPPLKFGQCQWARSRNNKWSYIKESVKNFHALKSSRENWKLRLELGRPYKGLERFFT